MAAFNIRNDVGATVFSILSGLSILFLTAWMFSPGGCAGPKQATIDPLPTEADADLAAQQLADTEASLEAEAARRADLALKLRESNELVSTLRARNEELRSANAEATTRASNLKATLDQKQAELAGLAALEARVKKLSAEKASLSAQLAESPAADAAALEAELASLKKQLAAERKACNEAKSTLNAEIEKLQKGLDQALYGDQLKPAGDFPALDLPYLVNDPIQLDRKVRPVFIGLRSIDENAGELQKVYEKLTEDGKTSALHQVPFTVGSADVSEAEQGKLSDILKDSPKGARYLVVGYASTDGDAKSNHELSSKRASSVAAEVAGLEGIDKDSVQAVYFGQTKRFSAEEMAPNRIVEVWRVK